MFKSLAAIHADADAANEDNTAVSAVGANEDTGRFVKK